MGTAMPNRSPAPHPAMPGTTTSTTRGRSTLRRGLEQARSGTGHVFPLVVVAGNHGKAHHGAADARTRMTRNSVEPSDGELYEQLVGYLDAEGAVEEDTERGVVTITEFDPVRSRRRSTSSSRRCRR